MLPERRNWMDWEASRGWGRLQRAGVKDPRARRGDTKADTKRSQGLEAPRNHPGEGCEASRVLLKGKSSPDPPPRLWNLQSGQRQGKARKVHPCSWQKRSCERHEPSTRPQPPLHRQRYSWGGSSARRDGLLLLPGVSWDSPTPSWRCPSSSPVTACPCPPC